MSHRPQRQPATRDPGGGSSVCSNTEPDGRRAPGLRLCMRQSHSTGGRRRVRGGIPKLRPLRSLLRCARYHGLTTLTRSLRPCFSDHSTPTPHHTMTRLLDAAASLSPVSLARRSFLAAGAAAVASTAFGRDFGPGTQPVRYPDPDLVQLDPRFAQYKLGNTPIQRLYHSPEMLWAEGPAWNGVGRYLLRSDIPNNVQMRWLEEDGHVTTFRHPPATRTATRSITRGGRSVANTATAASSVTSMTARSPSSRRSSRGSRSMRLTTPSCIRTTGRSGSPTPATAA